MLNLNIGGRELTKGLKELHHMTTIKQVIREKVIIHTIPVSLHPVLIPSLPSQLE